MRMFINPETGKIIQGEAPGPDFARGGRRDFVQFQCIHCGVWGEYKLSNPEPCHNCGKDPVVDEERGLLPW